MNVLFLVVASVTLHMKLSNNFLKVIKRIKKRRFRRERRAELPTQTTPPPAETNKEVHVAAKDVIYHYFIVDV